MTININMENEFLLKSIIESEKWIVAPEESDFYFTIEEIKNNSDSEYKDIIKDFINELRKFKYIDIENYINVLILLSE